MKHASSRSEPVRESPHVRTRARVRVCFHCALKKLPSREATGQEEAPVCQRVH